MSRLLTLDLTGAVEEYPGERVIRVRLGSASIVPWTISLCMLKEDVIESLAAHSMDRQFKIRLRRAQGENAATLEGNASSRIVGISLSNVELDRWVFFFLSYLRDGLGAVDHIDVDVAMGPKGTERGMLILHVPEAAPPVSGDEAMRRLSLM